MGTTRLALTVISFAALMAVPALSSSARAGHVRIGDQLPKLELAKLGGDKLQLADLRGQVTVVAFYSPVCEPCHKMLPVLVDLVHRMSVAKNVKIPLVVIALDGEPEKEVVARSGADAMWLIDSAGDADDQFDPQVRPCTYLVDKAGIIRHINRGYGDGYKDRVEQWLHGMLEGKTQP